MKSLIVLLSVSCAVLAVATGYYHADAATAHKQLRRHFEWAVKRSNECHAEFVKVSDTLNVYLPSDNLTKLYDLGVTSNSWVAKESVYNEFAQTITP